MTARDNMDAHTRIRPVSTGRCPTPAAASRSSPAMRSRPSQPLATGGHCNASARRQCHRCRTRDRHRPDRARPCSNGIGSDLFAIVWDGSALVGLNASGRAPKAVTSARYAGASGMPQRGWRRSPFPVRSPAGPRYRSATAPCPSPIFSGPRSATRATATRFRRSSPRNGRSQRPCCRAIWALATTSCPRSRAAAG